MGLGLVEFVMAAEASFGLEIPDREAEHIVTPRDMITFLADRLNATDAGTAPCLTQRAFYHMRTAIASRFGVLPEAVRPSTPIAELMPGVDRRQQWRALRDDLAAENWPNAASGNWLGKRLGVGHESVGEVAQHYATYNAATVLGSESSWSRGELERAVVRLVEAEFGVDMAKFTLDSGFVRDMGID